MAVMTKRFKAAEALVDRSKSYSIEEAMDIVAQAPPAKFDESVDVSLRLGVDPKHADQMVRGAIVLPHGIGKAVRVAVFAKGEKEREARDAGADVVGAEDLVEKIQGGFMEHIVARDSGAVVLSRRPGVVEYVSANRIVVRAETRSKKADPVQDLPLDIYNLTKYRRSNQNTCINQRPIVKKGDRVHADLPHRRYGQPCGRGLQARRQARGHRQVPQHPVRGESRRRHRGAQPQR